MGVGALLLRAIATYLGLDAGHFGREFAEPTLLFRIFNYPPHDEAHGEASTAVGEHTDYGYLTLLRQDDTADGLQAPRDTLRLAASPASRPRQRFAAQVRSECGEWVDVPPIEDTLVVNLGDALEHNTAGARPASPCALWARSPPVSMIQCLRTPQGYSAPRRIASRRAGAPAAVGSASHSFTIRGAASNEPPARSHAPLLTVPRERVQLRREDDVSRTSAHRGDARRG